MQHKSLFAAMMLGALVLGSCVKNEESQSVKDIRRARAEEIRTQAELNMANVQATITLANAQAAIAAAEAKLKEAEAAIAMAEAAKKLAEAELIGVQVQIAQVKLQEEQVTLLAKRAELEKLIAQYEAEIAQFEADKQAALNKLAQAEMEAEINEIKMARKLIEEEESLMKAIAQFGKEKEKEINSIWKQYSDEVTALNAAQTKLIKTMADLAKLEAGSETSGEILAERIRDLEARIEAQKLYISELKSKMEFTKPELDAVLKLATAEVATALTDQQQALEASTIINNSLIDKQSASYVYEQGWYDGDNFIAWLNSIVDEYNVFSYEYEGNTVDVFYLTDEWNEETQRWETGVYYYFESGDPYGNYAMYNTFVPLYTMNARWSSFDGTPVVYPTSVDGKTPTFSDYFWPRTYTPAKIYFENLAELMSIVASIQAEQYKDDVIEYREDAQYASEYFQKRMAALAEEIEAQTKYVEEAYPEVENAYEAYVLAEEELTQRSIDWDVAYDKYYHYIDLHESSIPARIEANAIVNVKSAKADLEEAQDAFDKAQLVLFGSVINDAPEGGLIAKVALLETEAYEAAKLAAEKKADMDKKEKELDEANKDDKLVHALQEAQEAVVIQNGVIAKAEDDADDARVAYRRAEIIYTADPTDENKKAMEDAKKTWEEAVAAVETEKGKLPDLQKAVSDAQAAWDKVNDPYQEALKAYNEAKESAQKVYDQWQAAKNTLGTRVNPEIGTAYYNYYYTAGNLEDAKIYLREMEQALADAQAANQGDEELNALRVAYYEAQLAYWAADDASDKAYAAYLALINGEEAKYPLFWESYYHVTPGCAVEFPEMFEYNLGEWGPGQNLARYVWYEEQAQWYKEYYQNLILQSDYATLVKKYNALASKLGEYAAEEEAYLENIEEMQDLYDNLIEANVAYIDASNKLEEARALKNALETIKTLVMYSEDGETVVSLEEYNRFIVDQEKELVRLEERMQKLMNELYFGEWLADEGKYAEAKILELQNEIQALQVEIEMRAALIEKYLDILSHLLSEVE